MSRKIVVLALALIAISIGSCTREKNREIFEDFEGQEGIYMIKLPPALFLGMLDSESALKGADVGNIDFVKLLVFDESNSTLMSSGDLVGKINDKFNRFGYELAVQLSSNSTDISAYILESEEYVSDLMILIRNDGSLIGLGLSGKLNGNSLMKFASEIDYNDLKDIADIDGFGF